MPFAKVDIAGGQASSVSDLSVAASSVINWETDAAGINKPRAALSSYSFTSGTLPNSAINGLCRWRDHLIEATVSGLWNGSTDGAPTATFALNDSTADSKLLGGLRPTFVSGQDDVYACAGNQIRRWSPARVVGATLAASPNCTHIASLGQYLISNDLGEPHAFRWSDIGEGVWDTWPAENITEAATRPDPVVALADTANELFVWGTNTLQVYQTGSDPTLPFDLVSSVDRGISAPYAFCRVDEQFAFLDDLRRIVISDGRSVETISDAIQSDLRGLTTISDCWAYRLNEGQTSRLVFRFPTATRTFVYDMSSKNWVEYKQYSAPFSIDYAANAYAYWPAVNKHMVGSTVAGVLLYVDSTARLDGTAPIVCERVTGWHDHGTPSRKRCVRLRTVLRRGNSTTSTVADQGQLEVRIQDDDKPWGEWDSIALGDASQYENDVDLFPAGVYRRRRYGLRYSNTESLDVAEMQEEQVECAP